MAYGDENCTCTRTVRCGCDDYPYDHPDYLSYPDQSHIDQRQAAAVSGSQPQHDLSGFPVRVQLQALLTGGAIGLVAMLLLPLAWALFITWIAGVLVLPVFMMLNERQATDKPVVSNSDTADATASKPPAPAVERVAAGRGYRLKRAEVLQFPAPEATPAPGRRVNHG